MMSAWVEPAMLGDSKEGLMIKLDEAQGTRNKLNTKNAEIPTVFFIGRSIGTIPHGSIHRAPPFFSPFYSYRTLY
jgi:hypothetical protein